jgi:hypothetical protein
MSTKVLLKKSSVLGKTPLRDDLSYGELALNYADGKLYFRNSSDQINSFYANPTLDLVTDNGSTTSNTLNVGGLTIGGELGFAFPNTDGDLNQILITDGNGNLQWTNLPEGGTGGTGGTGTSGLLVTTDAFTSNGTTTEYSLSAIPLNSKYCTVVINGLIQPTTSYSVLGSTLTLGFTPNSGDVIEIRTYTGDITSNIDSITDLSDVDTSTVEPEVGQVLKWNGVNWVPSDIILGSIDADTLDGYNSSYFLNYNNLTNTPTIYTDVNQLTDNSGILFSGSYNDLTNKPTLFSGSYNDLTNKPTIPTKLSDLTNDSGYITTESDPVFTASPAYGIISSDIAHWDDAYGWGNHASAGYLTSSSSIEWTQIANKPDLATTTYVNDAISDLVNGAPELLDTLNELAAALGDDPNFATTITTQLGSKQDTLVSGTSIKTINGESLLGSGNIVISGEGTGFSGDYNDLINKPTLFSGKYEDLTEKPVLFSGDYNDLTNKPTIPTVPTSLSEFTNDVGFITSYTETDPIYTTSSWYTTANNSSNWDTSYGWGNHASVGYLTSTSSVDWAQIVNEPILFSGSYTDLTDKPTIPTLISQLTNDSNFVNTTQLATKQNTLVSGTNIKTINGQSILGSGNITIAASSVSTLNDLTDVDTVTTPPSNGQSLVYNASNGRWVPQTVAGSGGSLQEYSASITSTSPSVIDSFNKDEFSGGRYTLISINDELQHSVTDFLVIHNGTAALIEPVANTSISGSTGNYTININGSNIEIIFTGSSNATNIKFTRSLISKVTAPVEQFVWPTDLETETYPEIDLETQTYPEKDLN